jgi:hypothetical protein
MTPLIVSVDVEPDGLFIDRHDPRPWLGFEAALEGMERIRAAAGETTGRSARFSWKLRMDHQVEATYGTAAWPVERYHAAFERLFGQGDDVGIHVHPFRLIPGTDTWVADFSDPAWVAECIESSVAAFRSAFGIGPRTASMGHNWQSRDALDLFHRLGIRIDLSLEHGTVKPPFYDGIGAFRGDRPSFEAVPDHPYHPAEHDFCSPDPDRRESVWIIPLSSVPDPLTGRRVKVALRDGPGPIGRLPLGPAPGPPCPLVAVRSSDFLDAGDRVIAALESVLDAAAFITPAEALAAAGLTSAG